MQGVGVLQGSRQHPGRADPPAADGSAGERTRRATEDSADHARRVWRLSPSSSPRPASRCASVSHSAGARSGATSSSNINSRPNAPSTTAEPPTINGKCRFTQPNAPPSRPSASPVTRNGKPRPSEYATSSVAAGPHAVLVRGDAEDRAEDRTDARRPAEAERDARDDRRGVAEAAELRMEALLLVQPRRAQEQRAEQEQRHREHHARPRCRVSTLWWSRSSCPKLDAESPSATNTVPKPATNSAVVRDDAACCARASRPAARRGRGR